jgi:hypothetical protein
MILLTRKTNACTHLENLLLLYCSLVSVETFELLFTLFFFQREGFTTFGNPVRNVSGTVTFDLRWEKKKSQLTNI